MFDNKPSVILVVGVNGSGSAAGLRMWVTSRDEAKGARALEIGALSFTTDNSILNNNLEAKRPAPAADGPPIAHPNIRGSRYFH